MISNHLSLVEQQRQHVDSISERTAVPGRWRNDLPRRKPGDQPATGEALQQDRS